MRGPGKRGKGEDLRLDPELFERVKMFKHVYDSVVEQEAPWEEYLNCLVAFGLDRMLRDAVPAGKEWETVQGLFNRHPELVMRYVAECWRKGNAEKREKGSGLLEDIERVRSYIG